jgi:hypothetical protein
VRSLEKATSDLCSAATLVVQAWMGLQEDLGGLRGRPDAVHAARSMGRTFHNLGHTRLIYLDAVPCHGRLITPADQAWAALAHRGGQACDVWAEHAPDFLYEPPSDSTLVAIAVQIAEVARCLNQLPGDRRPVAGAHRASSGHFTTVPIVPAWRMLRGDRIVPARRTQLSQHPGPNVPY